jgi:hypothetical protein
MITARNLGLTTANLRRHKQNSTSLSPQLKVITSTRPVELFRGKKPRRSLSLDPRTASAGIDTNLADLRPGGLAVGSKLAVPCRVSKLLIQPAGREVGHIVMSA